MKRAECARESEVIELVSVGAWPDGVPESLRAHAASCEACATTLRAVQALQAERDRLLPAAHVPSAGLVWWRAQRRAQQEAARRADRPILVAQWAGIVAAAIGAVVLGSQAGAWWPSWAALSVATPSDGHAAVLWSVLLGAAALALVVAPLALYLTRGD